MTVGLTSATAIPHFVGNDLTAFTVLFCGDNAHHVGAIELWNAPAGEPQMSFYDGYFGRAEKFEFVARHTQFSRKVGLPGIVWDRRCSLSSIYGILAGSLVAAVCPRVQTILRFNSSFRRWVC